MAEKKDKTLLIVGIIAAAGIAAYFIFKPKPAPPPGYPREICRDPYCFDVYNQAEETQMNDFLGIYPPGVDIDTYLAALTQQGLIEWKNYWVNMWNSLGRSDMIPFVNEMYDKYSVEEVSATINSFTISTT